MDIKIPAVGESITEVTIAEWRKKDGDFVQQNDVLILVETDKATVEVAAEKSGLLKIKTPAGQVVPVGSVVGELDTNAVAPAGASAPPVKMASGDSAQSTIATQNNKNQASQAGAGELMPAAKRLAAESAVDTSRIEGSGRGGRILKEDVQRAAETAPPAPAKSKGTVIELPPRREIRGEKSSRTVPMTTIRKRIAARLVEAQSTAAILTTFNEVDMTAYNRLKDTYGEKFKEKYGTRLGFLGLFAKGCIEGLRAFPGVNAFIDGDNIIYNDFYNFGIAVSTENGLVVPVIRDVDELSIAEIELEIKRVALKARDGKLGIDDMRGGTFTITNGGVFGSLMSTPILNPPQSGILGLHKVQDRPMALNGKVEVRPMMYIALSYDHRMVDGKEAVSFLVKVKECLEDPERVLIGI